MKRINSWGVKIKDWIQTNRLASSKQLFYAKFFRRYCYYSCTAYRCHYILRIVIGYFFSLQATNMFLDCVGVELTVLFVMTGVRPECGNAKHVREHGRHPGASTHSWNMFWRLQRSEERIPKLERRTAPFQHLMKTTTGKTWCNVGFKALASCKSKWCVHVCVRR